MSKNKKEQKLWGGRFLRSTSPQVEAFTHSLSVDQRLAKQDLLGSIAHAQMLGKTAIIPRSDARRIVEGLKSLLRDLDRGKLDLDQNSEDIHTALQNALERRIGKAAQRLHTARSRNDQIVTDLRLYCKEQIQLQQAQILKLQQTILGQAQRAGLLVLPGYTHLRHAQPLLAAHLFLSYAAALQRDWERLEAAYRHTDELPLGSGALTGSGLATNRKLIAQRLGFSGIMENSVDAVTSRDFAGEILSALSLLGVHLSRIAEDLLLWSTSEFGFLRFGEEMLTGSSMMPQKQNPDFLELVRANSARLIGNLTSLLALLKGLPSGYQRDLQLDKEILFDSLDRSEAMLGILAQGISTIRWNPNRISQQLQENALYATDLAEYLVARGVPFSQAHQAVGQLLQFSEQKKKPLRALPLPDWRRFSPAFGADVLRLLDPQASVRQKKSSGSTNPRLVLQAIRRWKIKLGR